MLEIDGSRGEGGGSVLRFSLALSAVNKEPIKVSNIRAGRSNPGLGNQHLAAVRGLKELTNAEVKGDRKGSREITFKPRSIQGGKIEVEIGTAGSTTLILQALMIPACFANETVRFEITGGTDNPFAPPIDYLKNVTLPLLRTMRLRGEVRLIRRGHYPKGGGKIEGEIEPNREFENLKLTDPGEVASIYGRSHCVKLPGHIANRQAKAAREVLKREGYEADIEEEFYKKSEDPHLSPGTGIVLWARTEKGAIIGSSSLGEKGKPAEEVGKEAAEDLIKQVKTGYSFDRYMTDQIIPYLGLAKGNSKITSSEITLHATTNARLVEKILDAEIKVEGSVGEPGEIKTVGKTS
ncbi:MAG: RNA 3'-terminal phosphate cyclase [Candidatus Hadarchaeia archaeon]